MHIRVISPVQDEIAAIAMRYHAESPSAAVRFFDEFDRLKALIRSNPKIGRSTDNGLRRFPFRHFPFDLVYEVRPDEVVITMVAHHRRNPSPE
jgi:plasmid stabilization system protein ParE